MNTLHCSSSSSIGSGFRFLYGRWILKYISDALGHGKRSDSSMVDEYLFKLEYGTPLYSSDSSMVDEYQLILPKKMLLKPVQIPLWSMNT